MWSQEHVQTWVTAFPEGITESQKALDAILTAAQSHSQVGTCALNSTTEVSHSVCLD